MSTANSSTIKVETYDKKYHQAFIDLNKQWIQHYFRVEEMDIQQLEHAKENIIDIGGEIFVVLIEEQVVAVCAMVPHGPDCYELAKMAVSPTARGKGLGDALMKASLDWARNKKAKKVMLLSNTVLTPAISLYKKHGFKTVQLGPHPDYERCNIEMEIELGGHS